MIEVSAKERAMGSGKYLRFDLEMLLLSLPYVHLCQYFMGFSPPAWLFKTSFMQKFMSLFDIYVITKSPGNHNSTNTWQKREYC